VKTPNFIGLVWSLDLITRHNWFDLVIVKSKPTRPMYTLNLENGKKGKLDFTIKYIDITIKFAKEKKASIST